MPDAGGISEDDFLEKAHQMSLSEHPKVAALGRFLKEFGPIIPQYAEREQERGTDMEDTMFAIMEGMFMALTATLPMIGITDRNQQIRALRVIRKGFDRRFKRQIRDIRRGEYDDA